MGGCMSELRLSFISAVALIQQSAWKGGNPAKYSQARDTNRGPGLMSVSPGPPRRPQRRAPYAYRTMTCPQPETAARRAATEHSSPPPAPRPPAAAARRTPSVHVALVVAPPAADPVEGVAIVHVDQVAPRAAVDLVPVVRVAVGADLVGAPLEVDRVVQPVAGPLVDQVVVAGGRAGLPGAPDHLVGGENRAGARPPDPHAA